MGRRRLRILYGLFDPPAPLHWPIVSRRRPIDSLVLVAVPARSNDARDSKLHSSHDGTGVSLGGRLCLPPHALRNLCLQDGAGVPVGRTGGSRQQSLSGRCCVVTRDDVGRISWIERRTARRSVLGGGGDLGQSCSDRHRDRDSAYQSICDRAPAGTRLCRGTEPQSPGSIHCLLHDETVVRILRETQDALRTHWGRGQDTGGPERAKESDDPIAGERTIEVAGGSKRASPNSQTLRLRAAGQPADGDDSKRRNPATSAQHSRPLIEWIAARDRRDERGFEVRSSRFSEFRTPNIELRIAPFSQVSRVTLRSSGGFFHHPATSARCLSGHSSPPAPPAWPRRTDPPPWPPITPHDPPPCTRSDRGDHPTNVQHRRAARWS